MNKEKPLGEKEHSSALIRATTEGEGLTGDQEQKAPRVRNQTDQ